MKTMKKLFALLLAVLMVMGMATTAMADPITITIANEATGHKYEAYQVFAGTLSSDGKVLTEVEWGSGVDGTALLAALKSSDLFKKDSVNVFAGCANAADVAKVVSGWGFNDTTVKNFADMVAANLSSTCFTSGAQSNKQYVITVNEVGYYFVKDVQAVTGADAATDYLLHVTSNTAISPKISAPTFKKTVNIELDTTYHEAIDAQIGDTVYFKLETKLPSLYNDYKQYHMVMQDVLPEGLTFNKVEDIYVAHAAGGTSSSYLANYTEDNNTDRTMTYAKKYGFNDATSTLTINFGDLKITQQNPNLNNTFVVKYSAIVNSDAVFGLNGDLGNKNTATLYFSNNMNETDAATAALGSLSDTANVYTYQLEVTKQDSADSKPLEGAEFYLYRNFAEKDAHGNEVNVKKYAHTTNGVITEWSAATPAEKLVSGADGKFVVKGLDSLSYHLEEVKAPDGYNKMEDAVKVTIDATITDHTLTSLTGDADGIPGTGTVADGKVSVAVNNTAGSTLPATGGIGTTIFYIVGGVLVLGAGAAFVMKRRNEA